MNSSNILINNLSVKYGQKIALDGVSAEIRAGKITALLGRNGVGKTSMLRAVSGRLKPSSGHASIAGERIYGSTENSSKIYITTDYHRQMNKMKIEEIMNLSGIFYPKADPAELKSLLTEYGISISSRPSDLSLGQKSLLQVGLALSSNAEYIFLDEGANALDAPTRQDIYSRILKKFIETGCTIVISTHIIAEIENLIEDLLILKSPSEIICAEKDQFLSEYSKITGEKSQILAYTSGLEVLQIQHHGKVSAAYIKSADTENIPAEIKTTPVNLDEIFAGLTNYKDNEGEFYE